MSSPSRILEEGEVGDFVSRDADEANPRGLTHAVAIRYKDSGPSEPKPVIFRGIYRLQRKSGCFSVNLNAESVRPIKDSVLGVLRCSLPCLDETDWRKVTGRKGRKSGGTRADRKAGAGCQCKRPRTRKLSLEVKSDTCFTIPGQYVIESWTLKK